MSANYRQIQIEIVSTMCRDINVSAIDVPSPLNRAAELLTDKDNVN